ncbi:hypothetical protein JCM6292_2559 [Bacteroides pyogenes JCM 6292]|uniref:Uncharacterized protein n=2 Tax=Bacteroides pyogenes TaxID=310300 RepID=W4PIF9_9BACE|nr:hypothetical protein JCM6292_2559 [Bacteroides pyogenes JCM 6292]GAE18909.1 hypothetical protein JCM6294_1873 [Bacteroides pyogenes DSM 20611 = JCM 6294]
MPAVHAYLPCHAQRQQDGEEGRPRVFAPEGCRRRCEAEADGEQYAYEAVPRHFSE